MAPATAKSKESSMHYRQITSHERYLISTLRLGGFAPAQMAAILGRHRSSITREIRRNATRADGCYLLALTEN